MRTFSELIDRIVLTPSRNGKLTLLTRYFAATPDPDRGYALAALTGGLDLPSLKPAMLRAMTTDRIDAELFAYSYDYVGDLAETIALIWPTGPKPGQHDDTLRLSDVVEQILASTRSDAAARFAHLLDRLDAAGRFAAIKLVTGGLRIGISARLAKQALADLGGVDVSEVEEVWHGLTSPYIELFAWLEGRAKRPDAEGGILFRPVMLANPLEESDLARLAVDDYRAEWKWDGIRVQVSARGGECKLFSRKGDDVSGSFPDLVAAVDFHGVIDGELLVGSPGIHLGTFSDLQQRLNRKTANARLQSQYPVFVRAYDLLFAGGEDLRALPFVERRRRLETFLAHCDPSRFDLSEQMDFADWQALDHMRRNPPHPIIEGVMLKHVNSTYEAGRPKGPWFKWKQDPYTVDAVLMYAQRGHGKRSSFYSDYTFGVWQTQTDGSRNLVPVGKAYFGFTDEELKAIDKFVRDKTIDRFGPVRSVIANAEQGLVLEIAFEGINRSARHKSGLAMRFPRIGRIRWDKPPGEADTIDYLEHLLDPGESRDDAARKARDRLEAAESGTKRLNAPPALDPKRDSGRSI